MSANSSSVRAAPEPKARAHISTHGLPGCRANSRMPATTIPTMPNTEWWMCSPPAVTMLPTPSLELPLARVTRVLRRARTNVRMKPASRKNSGRLASSSTCPGSVAKRTNITPLLSVQRAVRNHPGRPGDRRCTGTARGRPPGAAVPSSDGRAGGRRGARRRRRARRRQTVGQPVLLDVLEHGPGQALLALDGEVHAVGQPPVRGVAPIGVHEETPGVDVLGPRVLRGGVLDDLVDELHARVAP